VGLKIVPKSDGTTRKGGGGGRGGKIQDRESLKEGFQGRDRELYTNRHTPDCSGAQKGCEEGIRGQAGGIALSLRDQPGQSQRKGEGRQRPRKIQGLSNSYNPGPIR